MKIDRIVFAARNQVEVDTMDLDIKLKPRDILIQTHCSQISTGTEIAALTGKHSKSDWENPPDWLRFPSVPGYLMCGEIVDEGSDARRFKVGDRVVAEGPGCWNSHCSHLIVDEEDPNLVLVRPEVSSDIAAMDKMGAIAMNGVRVAHPQFGDSVALFGLGVVGQIACRLYQLAGAAQVVAIDPIERRRQIALLAPFVEASAPDDPAVAFIVPAGNRESGFDCVVEASGSPDAFLRSCEIARMRGKVVILSSPHRFVEMRLYDHVHSKSLQLFGAHGSFLPGKPTLNDPYTDLRQKRFFMNLLAQKRLDIKPLVSHAVSFQEAPGMYRGILENPDEYLGVQLYWNDYKPL